MKNESIVVALAKMGLRLANADESGWYVRFATEEGVVSVWATDLD